MNKRLMWGNARTLLDLGELVARWLEGRIPSLTHYDAEPAPETEAIAEILARLNRAGFFTTDSQPGMPLDNTGFAQRAWVNAYAGEEIAKRVAALGLHTDLIVFVFEPGQAGGYPLPITVRGFQPVTWDGLGCADVDLYGITDGLSESARGELRAAWNLVVIDPAWGRKSYLWELVERAVVSPDPKEGRWNYRPYGSYDDMDPDYEPRS